MILLLLPIFLALLLGSVLLLAPLLPLRQFDVPPLLQAGD